MTAGIFFFDSPATVYPLPAGWDSSDRETARRERGGSASDRSATRRTAPLPLLHYYLKEYNVHVRTYSLTRSCTFYSPDSGAWLA